MSINNILKKQKANEKILPILDKVIVDFFTHNRMRHVGIYPSQLGGCLRKQVLMMLNVELDPFPADTFRKFHNGNDTHDRIQGYIQLAYEEGKFKKVEFEKQIKAIDSPNKQLQKFKNVVAQLDGLVTLMNGVECLIEVKSMNWRAYDKSDLYPEYVYQAQVYMLLTGKKECLLIKENKNDNTWKEMVVKEDKAIQKIAIEKMKKLNKHIADKTLPRKACDSKSCKKAGWCNAKTICFSMLNDWGDYELITEDTPLKKIVLVKGKLLNISVSPKMRDIVYGKCIETFLRDEDTNECQLPIDTYGIVEIKKIIQNMINSKRLFHVKIKYEVKK